MDIVRTGGLESAGAATTATAATTSTPISQGQNGNYTDGTIAATAAATTAVTNAGGAAASGSDNEDVSNTHRRIDNGQVSGDSDDDVNKAVVHQKVVALMFETKVLDATDARRVQILLEQQVNRGMSQARMMY